MAAPRGAIRRLVLALCAISIAAGTPSITQGAEMKTPKQAGKKAKTGPRLVGVSCVCYGSRASVKDMERYIDTAALDEPDIILLTEGCMHLSLIHI